MTTPNLSVYFNSSTNGTGVNASIRMLKEQYHILATRYEQKGMKREAEIFSNIVREFDDLQQEMLKPKTKQVDQQSLNNIG